MGALTTAPTVAPTVAPTSSDDVRTIWFYIFIAACIVGGIGLVFLIVVGAAKPAVPSSVVVITQNPDGTDTDGGNARMLMSRDNYQQKIHYH